MFTCTVLHLIMRVTYLVVVVLFSSVVAVVVVVGGGGCGGGIVIVVVLVVVVASVVVFLPGRLEEGVLHGRRGPGGWPLSPSFIPGSHHGPGRCLVVRLDVCVVVSSRCHRWFRCFRRLRLFLHLLCESRSWIFRGSVLFFDL